MQNKVSIARTKGIAVKPCPTAGEGVHRWIYHVVCRMIDDKFDDHEIVSFCDEHSTRALQPYEVENAIRSRCGSLQNSNRTTRPHWPRPSAILVDQITGTKTVNDLSNASPIPLEGYGAERVIDHLFPGNPLLCCGVSSRDEWRGQLAKLQLIVPSTMNARHGLTQAGKRSAHTLENTGPRKYLVVEFDEGSHDDHASLLFHLNTSVTPLVCAVTSGNKSLHGWFLVEDWSEDKLVNFFKRATSVGADPATWTRSQFVRMPNGKRDNGANQTTLYLSK
mgnify:FL=1